MTLKNTCDLLDLSYIYCADQLRCCLDFIVINLQTLIEDQSLLRLSEEAIEDLTRTYQNLVTNPRNRRILRSRDAPEEEELVRIHSLFDPNDEYVFDINIDRKAVVKQKTKIKSRLNRTRYKLTFCMSITTKPSAVSDRV